MGSPLVGAERLLLRELIDYAGLFPPARLDLAAAVAAYRVARDGQYAWVLGRFLCPTSRLEELGGALTATMTAGEQTWDVGVIFDLPPAAAAAAAQAFDAAMDPAARVTVAELRTPDAAAEGRSLETTADALRPYLLAATSISPRVTTYIEIPLTAAWHDGIPLAIEAVAKLGRHLHREVGVKLRCGGLELDDFPSCAQVARFISASVSAEVAFKATAGLHRPVRHFDPTLGGYRHGFMNLLAATALAEVGASEETLEIVLAEEEANAFALGVAGLQWRRHTAGPSVIKRIRRDAFTAYGSCDFDEPIADLVGLQIVAAAQ